MMPFGVIQLWLHVISYQ